MNASFILLLIPTLCYVGVAVDQARHKSPSNALVYAGYALANVGLIWSLK